LSRNVQVVEGVLVQEVGVVEEEDGMDPLAGELLDVGRHGVEEVAGGGGRREAEREAELAVEVAAAEGGVVRVGQAVAGGGDAVAERAQDTGLADAGFTDEHHRGALGERGEEAVGDGLLGGGQPEVGVGDLLGERRLLEPEAFEVGHGFSLRWRGGRPAVLSRRAPAGSNGMVGVGASLRRRRRVREAATGSAGRIA
jgi:hypothetical protein